MTTPQEPKPRRRRYNAHYRVRLDAKRHAKIEELLAALQRKRAAILRYVMQRGLTHTHEWTIDPSIPDRPHLVHMLLEPHLLQQVQDAADAHDVIAAAWVRHAMRQVTPDDFPPSWRVGDIGRPTPRTGQEPQTDIDGVEEVTSEAVARGRIRRHRLRHKGSDLKGRPWLHWRLGSGCMVHGRGSSQQHVDGTIPARSRGGRR